MQQPGIERSLQQRLEQRRAAVDETIQTRVNETVREHASEIRQKVEEISSTPSTSQAHQTAYEKEKTVPQADRAKEVTAIGGAPGPEFKPPKDKRDQGQSKADIENKANHCFGEKNLAKHNLLDYLKSFGGDKVKAYKPLLAAAKKYVEEHGIKEADTQPYKQIVVNVNEYLITLKVKVVDGVTRVTTAFIPGIK